MSSRSGQGQFYNLRAQIYSEEEISMQYFSHLILQRQTYGSPCLYLQLNYRVKNKFHLTESQEIKSSVGYLKSMEFTDFNICVYLLTLF
jgi:hypothetical protein